jgi:hypothetical protein
MGIARGRSELKKIDDMIRFMMLANWLAISKKGP